LKYIFGDAFGPGYSGLAAARLLLRKEPSPAYPYRNFVFRLKYIFGDAFGPGYSGLALLGYCCAMNQALRIPIAVLILC